MSRTPSGPLTRLFTWLIELYQSTAAWRSPRCRFLPSCSHYAHEAISMHGPVRGAWLAVRRISRCHPLSPGGHDPVPAPRRRDGRTTSVAESDGVAT